MRIRGLHRLIVMCEEHEVFVYMHKIGSQRHSNLPSPAMSPDPGAAKRTCMVLVTVVCSVSNTWRHHRLRFPWD